MLEGKFPFNDTLNTSERDYGRAFGLFDQNNSPEAQSCLKGILKKDPALRLSCEQILKHEFIKISDHFVEAVQKEMEDNPLPPTTPGEDERGGSGGEEGGGIIGGDEVMAGAEALMVGDQDWGSSCGGLWNCVDGRRG